MTEGAIRPTFEPIEEPPGIRIVDPIDNTKFELHTDRPVSGATVDSDDFYFPVDAAVTVTVEEITIPRLTNVYLRTQDGKMIGESSNRNSDEYPVDAYILDVFSGHLKLYLETESEITIYREDAATHISFGNTTQVRIGTRSLHETPAGTITTTTDIEDLMRAVSYLGSSLKTTTCERSFPTLRGHPPLLEIGDEFEVPKGINRPDTDVQLVLPPEREYIYQASSLAYYLGAEVVPGDGPRLESGEFSYGLNAEDGFGAEVTRVLKQIFFLDCIVRTEGYYPVDLHERDEIEPDLPFSPSELYEQSLAEQLPAYLEIPYEDLESYIPQWKVTADVQPTASNVEVLPFTSHELAAVRCPDRFQETNVKPEPDELKTFYRSNKITAGDEELVRGGENGEVQTQGVGRQQSLEHGVRSTSQTSRSSQQTIVKPDGSSSLEHAWIGKGFPIGASKASVESYRRRLDRISGNKQYISVDIVCNDPEMSEEDVVQESYGARDFFEFDVDVHYELTCDELADVLAKETDFLHYIGHVDENGFQCTDGMLDAWELEEVNAEAFLLNACRSYEQGDALVQKGSLGGIVTLAKVCNDPAVRMGRALARLLNCGFPLYTGLSIARNVTLFGNQYISIGDGNLQLVKSENGLLPLAQVESEGKMFDLEFRTYLTSANGLGSLVTPHVHGGASNYLSSGTVDQFELTAGELDEFLTLETMPVLFENNLYWSDEITATDLLTDQG